jgi:hypothetical protein
MLLGVGEVSFGDTQVEVKTLCAITSDPISVNWDTALLCEIDVNDLEKDPAASIAFADLPPTATKPKSYDGWTKDFGNWIYRTQSLTTFKSPSSGVSSKQGETERDFRVRLQQSNREARDQAVAELRQKYAPKIAAAEERLRRAQQAQQVQAEQATSAKIQTAISFGATLLSGLMGRKAVSIGTVGRATTAARGVSRSMKEAGDAARAGETVEAVSQQLQALNSQLESEINQLTTTSDPATEKLETISLKPKKKDISIKLVGLAWTPYLQSTGQPAQPAW